MYVMLCDGDLDGMYRTFNNRLLLLSIKVMRQRPIEIHGAAQTCPRRSGITLYTTLRRLTVFVAYLLFN